MKKIIFVFMAMLMSISIFGCSARSYYMQEVHESITGVSQADVRKSVILAAEDLGWQTQEVNGNLVKATITRKGYNATVNINYSKSSYDITYVSSEGLNYDPDKKTIHGTYNRWLDNLNREIKRNLVKAKF